MGEHAVDVAAQVAGQGPEAQAPQAFRVGRQVLRPAMAREDLGERRGGERLAAGAARHRIGELHLGEAARARDVAQAQGRGAAQQGRIEDVTQGAGQRVDPLAPDARRRQLALDDVAQGSVGGAVKSIVSKCGARACPGRGRAESPQ